MFNLLREDVLQEMSDTFPTISTPSPDPRVYRALTAFFYVASTLLTPLMITLVFVTILGLTYIIASHIHERRKLLALAEHNVDLSSSDALHLQGNSWDASPALEADLGPEQMDGMPTLYLDVHMQGTSNPRKNHLHPNGDILFSVATEESDASEVLIELDEVTGSALHLPPSSSRGLPMQMGTIHHLMATPARCSLKPDHSTRDDSGAPEPWDLPLNDDRLITHTPAPHPPQDVAADGSAFFPSSSGVSADRERVDGVSASTPFLLAGFKDATRNHRRSLSLALTPLKINACPIASSLTPSSTTPTGRVPSTHVFSIEAENDDDDINDPNDIFHDAISTPLLTPASSMTFLPMENMPTSFSEISEPLLTARSFANVDHTNTPSPDGDASMITPTRRIAPTPFPDPEDLPLPDMPFPDSRPLSHLSATLSPLPSPFSTPSFSSPPCSRLQLLANSTHGVRPAHLKHRPAWSLRALEAPALGVPATSVKAIPADTASLSSPSESSGSRAELTSSLQPALTVHRIPQAMDVALAMQLHPALGIGADAAWMVRFLMAMYGWLVLMVSGQGRLVQ